MRKARREGKRETWLSLVFGLVQVSEFSYLPKQVCPLINLRKGMKLIQNLEHLLVFGTAALHLPKGQEVISTGSTRVSSQFP